MSITDGWRLRGIGRTSAPPTNFSIAVSNVSVTRDQWRHVGVRMRYPEGDVDVFINGVEQSATADVYVKDAGVEDASSWGLAIGAEDDGTGPYFVGSIDEVRISRVYRSLAWIELEHRSMLGDAVGGIVNVDPIENEP